MPILFVGHGSPMNAIENNKYTKNFSRIANGIKRPTAIACISAHWVTQGTKVTSMENPKTIHDFYGFPRELYDIEYKASGSMEIAKKVQDLLLPISVELNTDWGLDHGTWSVLRHMYPNANIPVVQISIDYTKSTEYHYNIAKKMKLLRQEGVLIIGSGNIVHNLSMIDFEKIETNYGFDWAIKTQKNINDNIINNNFEPLLNYLKQGDSFNLAIPTPEHFLPLIYILGLKEDNEKIEFFNNELVGGSISMTSIKIS